MTAEPIERSTTPAGRGDTGAVVAMIVATALWGGTFVAIRDALHAIDPVTLVDARFIVAALVFAPLLGLRARTLDRGTWVGAALSGACATGGYLFQAIGLTATSAGSSAFLTCMGTAFAAFYAWPLLGQRPGPRLLTGLALAIGGSALLATRSGMLPGPGEGWTLLGAAVYALQIVVLARVAPGRDAVALTAIQCTTIAVLLAPFAHGLPALAHLAAPDLARFGYLVVAGSIAAPLLQIIAQRRLPPGRVALLFALEPVFALLVALGPGHERFAARWWLGAALILAGVLWVEVRPPRRTGAVGAGS